MDEVIFSLWLRETGLRALIPSVAPGAGQVLADDETQASRLSPVADLDLADPEDDDDFDDSSVFADFGAPGDRRENTELVAAVFRLAGNPKYQDVRLRAAKTGHCPDPTDRELALERAKRADRSMTW